MNLVIDANILFSTLIKDSKTAELIINPLFNLYAPELFFEEFYSYYHLIIKKLIELKIIYKT